MIKHLTILFIWSGILSAQTTSGFIRQTETWDTDSVILTGSVTVAAGTLFIMPGTVVKGLVTDFKITGPGVIRAIGTPDDRIVFRGVKFIMEALTNDSLCVFRNCFFRNNYCLIEFRNPTGVTEISRLEIDSCEFYHGGYTNLYVTSGGEPQISSCSFHDASSGIFLHGGGAISITNTFIYNVSCGIINATHPDWHQDLTVDHVTIHKVDSTRSYDWANGYGITNGNEPGTLVLTNSIISTTDRYGLHNGYQPWVVTNDYNCFYQNQEGPSDLPLGDSTIQADPQFVNPAEGDFTLYDTSPCLNVAADGTHIGAWQGTPAGIRDIPSAVPEPVTVRHLAGERKFLFTAGAGDITLIISDLGGGTRFSGNGKERVAWHYGSALPGIYVATILTETGGQSLSILIYEREE